MFYVILAALQLHVMFDLLRSVQALGLRRPTVSVHGSVRSIMI